MRGLYEIRRQTAMRRSGGGGRRPGKAQQGPSESLKENEKFGKLKLLRVRGFALKRSECRSSGIRRSPARRARRQRRSGPETALSGEAIFTPVTTVQA
jgi:hypothetical protein